MKDNTNKYKELLEVGQVFKSYKELCNHLGENVKTSNSKKAQEKEWNRYFSFKKIGRYSLEILELHEEPKNKIDNRKGGNNTVKYIDKLEHAILLMLSKVEDDKVSVFLSKNKLLKSLNVVNDNYVDSKYRQSKLSNIVKISKYEIEDFYQSSDSLLYRNIEAALKRLRRKSLLIYESVLTVGYVETYVDTNKDGKVNAVKQVKIDMYGDETFKTHGADTSSRLIHRRATRKEKDIILATEFAILEKYDYETPRDAFLAGKFKEFYEEIGDYLFKNHNILMYYESYEITFNSKNVEDALTGAETSENQEVLNKEIMERMTTNAKNRSSLARKRLSEKPDNRRLLMRSSFDYTTRHQVLIDTLIDLNADPIE